MRWMCDQVDIQEFPVSYQGTFKGVRYRTVKYFFYFSCIRDSKTEGHWGALSLVASWR